MTTYAYDASGAYFYVLTTGMPDDPIKVGAGETLAEAMSNRSPTPTQSAGHYNTSRAEDIAIIAAAVNERAEDISDICDAGQLVVTTHVTCTLRRHEACARIELDGGNYDQWSNISADDVLAEAGIDGLSEIRSEQTTIVLGATRQTLETFATATATHRSRVALRALGRLTDDVIDTLLNDGIITADEYDILASLNEDRAAELVGSWVLDDWKGPTVVELHGVADAYSYAK